MTDKEIFKEELDRLKEETSIGLSEHDNGVEQGRIEVINSLYKTLHHMQEEPVSEDLEEAAHNYAWEKQERHIDFDGEEYLDYGVRYDAFKAGAQWQQNKQKHQYKSRPMYVGEHELLGNRDEQKPKWSKEDENIQKALVEYFDDSAPLSIDLVSAKYWLKSIKDRFISKNGIS